MSADRVATDTAAPLSRPDRGPLEDSDGDSRDPDLASLPLFAPPPQPLADLPRPLTEPLPTADATTRPSTVRTGLEGSDPAGQGGVTGGTPLGDHTAARPEQVDWALVRVLRQQVAERLAKEVERRAGLSEVGQRDLGRALIADALHEHARGLLTGGDDVFDAAAERALARATYDAMFGLGRLQPLVDDPDIENIEITGHDQVWLHYGDGRLQRGPAVGDSDEDLIADLQFLAAHGGEGERPFSSAHPTLDLQLRDGSRLAAMAWTTWRPTVTIRRHRHTDVDLARLRQLGMVDGALAAFLSAAVRAGRSIVVSGLPGAGKTTLVRALANELDPLERICTIETEYELLLHHLPDRHRRIVAMQARPGTGERTPDGREAGAVTLDQLVYDSLRHNVARIIVGEVRGPEILPMFKAMQAGRGSLSTTHADSARDAIERLTTCALEAGPHITETYAYRQLAQHIDLVVQVGVTDVNDVNDVMDATDGAGDTATGAATWSRRKARFVAEVLHLETGEGPGGMSVTDVFAPGPDGRAVPTGYRPPWLPDLTAAGFDQGWLDHTAGTWPAAAAAGRASAEPPAQPLPEPLPWRQP